VLNAANESAVAAFLRGEVGFLDIAAIVAEVLAQYEPPAPETLADVVAIDAEARQKAASVMRRMAA
jgi:1-deoxy-D-xylulose-5-phosphate reductoisomerase